MRKILPYNKKLIPLAKKLRKDSTLSEVLLWNKLKNKQIRNLDFDRQVVIDNYIVDFYCKDLMLAIEVDGSTHGEKIKYDKKRQDTLENFGIRFLRFLDSEIKMDMDGVMRGIENCLDENCPPQFDFAQGRL